MATSRTRPIIRHLRRVVALANAAGLSDEQLIDRFVATRDEEAFEALVRRHGPMVLGVCRRILGDPHEADDAFQATFLVLATKAASVVPAEMLPNWLYGVARQTAVRARSLSTKRRLRERHVAELPERPAAPTDPWDDLRRLLDEELASLPRKYRVAVVICDLEGRSHKDAASHLGWPLGSLASRHSRGRRMLKERLAKRGIGPSGVSLAAMLSPKAISASLLPSLIASTVQAGSVYGAGPAVAAGAVSLHVATLTEGVLWTMLFKKMKMLAAVLLVVGMGALGGGLLARHAANEPDVRQNRQPGPGPADKDAKKAVAEPKPKQRKNRLEVQATGKQVRVRAVLGAEELVAVADRMTYEEDGLLVLEGNARIRKQRRGQELQTIQGDRVVIDPRTGKIDARGVRMAVPGVGPAPIALDIGFPVAKGPHKESAGAKQGSAERPAGKPGETDVPALKKELEKLRKKVKKLEGRSADAEAGSKAFKMAEFYRRTGHGGAASFYYDIARRRQSGRLPGSP